MHWSKEEVIKKIERNKIIVVIRSIYGESLRQLVHALYQGGIECFEITYDPTDDHTLDEIEANIKELKKEYGHSILLGVGTVINLSFAKHGVGIGADFIVSPNFSRNVLEYCVNQDVVCIPGCMTPTEICDAHELGADFIKLFPAGTLGLKYCKDIYAPIHHVRFIATVGVTYETFKEYLELGFAGAGISSMLVDKQLRDAGNYSELTNRAKEFVKIARNYGRNNNGSTQVD